VPYQWANIPPEFVKRWDAERERRSRTIKKLVKGQGMSHHLSATRTDDGGYSIDPAELFRVYPPKSVAADREADRSAGHNAITIAPVNSTES